MAALAPHSQKAITDIIHEMTRPISEILGEPPLTQLEARPRKRPLPTPLRSPQPPSDADIIAITSSYAGPESFLQGGRVSGELGPTRKRARLENHPSLEPTGKKRPREERPPRPQNASKTIQLDTATKPATDNAKARPSAIKLTSQPAPREAKDDIAKKSRLSNTASMKKKNEPIKQPKKETKKHHKTELDTEQNKDAKEAKETPRKRTSPIPRVPVSVIPRSEPRPPRSSSPEENTLDADRHITKAKKKENEPKRLSIPRVPASGAAKRQRREEPKKTSANESSDRSFSSPERRRPLSRELNDDSARHRDRDYDTEREHEKLDMGRDRERERDLGSDRERSGDKDRKQDSIRRTSMRAERDKDVDRARERTKDRRERDRDHDRDRDGDRGTRGDLVRSRENGKLGDERDRTNRDRHRDRDRDYNRDNERVSLRRSLAPGRPDSARESTSGGQSPRDSRVVPLSSRPSSRSGPAQSPARDSTKPKIPLSRHGPAELSQIHAKQKDLDRAFKRSMSKCEEFYKNKHYDAFEEAAKQGFRLSFDIGLTMETELRLHVTEFKSLDATERAARKRTVINHYKYLTKTYAPMRMKELETIGRKDGCAFYRRGIQKAYFRMFSFHNIWEKDVQRNNTSLQRLLSDTVNARIAGRSNNMAEEEISTRKLKSLKRLVDDHINILSIFDCIAADYGAGFEEAGAEGYIP